MGTDYCTVREAITKLIDDDSCDVKVRDSNNAVISIEEKEKVFCHGIVGLLHGKKSNLTNS